AASSAGTRAAAGAGAGAGASAADAGQPVEEGIHLRRMDPAMVPDRAQGFQDDVQQGERRESKEIGRTMNEGWIGGMQRHYSLFSIDFFCFSLQGPVRSDILLTKFSVRLLTPS